MSETGIVVYKKWLSCTKVKSGLKDVLHRSPAHLYHLCYISRNGQIAQKVLILDIYILFWHRPFYIVGVIPKEGKSPTKISFPLVYDKDKLP